MQKAAAPLHLLAFQTVLVHNICHGMLPWQGKRGEGGVFYPKIKKHGFVYQR